MKNKLILFVVTILVFSSVQILAMSQPPKVLNLSNLQNDVSNISDQNESNQNIPRPAAHNTLLFITGISQSHTVRGSNFTLNGYTQNFSGGWVNTSNIPVYPILDGHLCDSISELIIDNWLTKNSIPHKRNASYPETNSKADWSVFAGNQKVFVEYFGLVNDSPRYDRTIKRKKELCRRYNLRLIEIYPQDIYLKGHLDIRLRDKFKDLINA